MAKRQQRRSTINYGHGFALRGGPSAVERIERTMARFTDATAPKDVELELREGVASTLHHRTSDNDPWQQFGVDALDPASPPALRDAMDRFGTARMSRTRWIWRAEASERAPADWDKLWRSYVAYYREHQDLPLVYGDVRDVERGKPPDREPLQLALSYTMNWRRPDGEVFPDQDETSYLTLWLEGRRARVSAGFRFPFDEPTPELVSYLDALSDALGYKFVRTHFRRWTPARKGSGGTGRKIVTWPAALPTAAPASAGDEVLKQLRDKPDDDELHAVAADILQDAGDVRGELIALQLAEADGKRNPGRARRIKQIINEHRDELLGALAPMTLAAGLEFQRGFATQIWLAMDRELPGAPDEAATLEQIHFRKGSGRPWAVPLLADPKLAALRVVTGVAPTVVRELAALAQPLPIEELVFGEFDGYPDYSHAEALAALSASVAFPRLRRLGIIGGWENVTPIIADTVRKLSLDQLCLSNAEMRWTRELGQWIALAHSCNLSRLELRSGGHLERDRKRLVWLLDRGDDGKPSALRIEHAGGATGWGRVDTIQHICDGLTTVAPNALSAIRIVSSKSLAINDEAATRLRMAAARFRGVRLELER